jgi:uncharacterized protein
MATALVWPGVEVRDLHSSILGQDMQLYVKLPWSYERSDKPYLVLYSLDANRSFPMYAALSLLLETPGSSGPETIVVGVGYKLDPDRLRGLVQWGSWRTRDLTPVRREEVERHWNEMLSGMLSGEEVWVQTGGAARFLRSLNEEIIPFVEANYRASEQDRGLFGYSYGGLFTLYALFHTPEQFSRYFAGSPTMWDALFEDEEAYACTHDDLRAGLYMTAGGYEAKLLEPFGRLAERLESRGYPGLDLRTHVCEGLGHRSAVAAAVTQALCELYHAEWLKQ